MAVGVDDIYWIKEGAKLLKTAKSEGWLDNLAQALKKKHNVLLLGPTGVGKSQVLTSLKDSVPIAIEAARRTEQLEPAQKVKIGKKPFSFFDTPGDDGKEGERAAGHAAHYSRRNIGLINVVSYGYHEYTNHSFEPFTTAGRPRVEYLEDHREREIRQLYEWMDLFDQRRVKPWLITVVNKADLWWGDRANVLKHYKSGAYGSVIGQHSSLGSVVVEHCAYRRNFYGVASTMDGSFEESHQASLEGGLVSEILTAALRP